MKHIITVATIKGGTGKTATAGALAGAAVKDGQRVLAVDLDPQANLSIWLNADLSKPGSYDLLNGRDPAETIQATEANISLIAGCADLCAVKTSPSSARRLEEALEALKRKYDFIVIDTAPQMGELQNNALFAANEILIPLEADSYSLQAFYQIADVAKLVIEAKPKLKFAGVIITQYDNRPNINRFMRDTIKEKCAEEKIPYLMEIRNSVVIREAMAMQQSLFDYAPKSKIAGDYLCLYEKIAK